MLCLEFRANFPMAPHWANTAELRCLLIHFKSVLDKMLNPNHNLLDLEFDLSVLYPSHLQLCCHLMVLSVAELS